MKGKYIEEEEEGWGWQSFGGVASPPAEQRGVSWSSPGKKYRPLISTWPHYKFPEMKLCLEDSCAVLLLALTQPSQWLGSSPSAASPQQTHTHTHKGCKCLKPSSTSCVCGWRTCIVWTSRTLHLCSCFKDQLRCCSVSAVLSLLCILVLLSFTFSWNCEIFVEASHLCVSEQNNEADVQSKSNFYFQIFWQGFKWK